MGLQENLRNLSDALGADILPGKVVAVPRTLELAMAALEYHGLKVLWRYEHGREMPQLEPNRVYLIVEGQTFSAKPFEEVQRGIPIVKPNAYRSIEGF